MIILVETHLIYTAVNPCSLLLQIEAAQTADQTVTKGGLVTDHAGHIIAGEDDIGVRRWLRNEGVFECTYTAQVEVNRSVVTFDMLSVTPFTALPSDVVKYLMPSRYCHPEEFLGFANDHIGPLSGGPLIAAMSDWITANFAYDNSASHAGTTAADSFAARAGVCRDYAHVLISMARASGIPARYVSVYAPDVTPQDFHAVAEVFLDGHWHLVDPTGMAQAPEIVRIGVGRDAADVSFLTSYGWIEFKKQSVQVSRIA